MSGLASGEVSRLACINRLITGNLPIITPRRGSGVNNPLNYPTGFRLNPFCEISEVPSRTSGWAQAAR